jgi:Bacteriophage tail sheath protein
VQSPQTPGVYYERVDASAPAIALLRTDIAGFVGIATRGPLHQPLPVQSWRQFQAYFGDFTGAGYLAYAARAFFENGGQRCWIVRVASETAASAALTLQSESFTDVWTISASGPGVWGNDLDIVIRETHRAQTLTVAQPSAPEFSTVLSTTGFGRATQVRLSQGATKIHKVVFDVDPVNHRLLWINPKGETQLPYSGLSGFDPERPIVIESIEYTLWVRELARLIRVYDGLSLVPEHPRYGPALLGEFKLPRFSGQTVNLPSAPEPVTITELRALPLTALESIAASADQIMPLTGGADGLAQLSTYDFIGAEIDPLDSDEVRAHKARGLRTLEDVREVAIVAVPDIHIQPKPTPRFSAPPPCIPDPCLPAGVPPAVPRPPSVGDLPPVFPQSAIYEVQAALIQHCEKLRDRIALLDPPYSAARDDKLGVGAVRAWRSRFDSKYAAFYYPWLRVVDPLRSPTSLVREIPPSGHVAGQYAQNDFQFGVHKAPANAPLIWAEDVTVFVDDAVHGILNPAGINAIRSLPGRGLRVFGARTMSSDTDWQHLNVRRLMMMIEKAIEAAIQWAVFEPNSILTRTKLNLTLTNFLLSLWQRGALMGASADDAFFVRCDDDNNPPEERDQGRLLATIGVAPSRPFEFIILRVGRAHNQFEISEASAGASGLEVF